MGEDKGPCLSPVQHKSFSVSQSIYREAFSVACSQKSRHDFTQRKYDDAATFPPLCTNLADCTLESYWVNSSIEYIYLTMIGNMVEISSCDYWDFVQICNQAVVLFTKLQNKYMRHENIHHWQGALWD